MDLRKDSLGRFTTDPSFNERLDKCLEKVKKELSVHNSNFGDLWASAGLPMLASNCHTKGGRVYGYIVKDQVGKGDLGDELRDLLNFAVYTNLYYEMLREKDE